MSYAAYKMMHWPTGIDYCAAGFITHSPAEAAAFSSLPPTISGPEVDVDSSAARRLTDPDVDLPCRRSLALLPTLPSRRGTHPRGAAGTCIDR